MVCIPIGYYLRDSCLYFLISICACVVIDIINLFINVIQVGQCYIYIILLYNYYELTIINKLYYLLISIILYIVINLWIIYIGFLMNGL